MGRGEKQLQQEQQQQQQEQQQQQQEELDAWPGNGAHGGPQELNSTGDEREGKEETQDDVAVRLASCLAKLGLAATDAGSDAAIASAWAAASTRDQDARAQLDAARAKHTDIQEKVARVGVWRRQLQTQLADLEAETAARNENVATLNQEVESFRVKRSEYAQQRREALAALQNVDLERISHQAILEKRARLDRALQRQKELRDLHRPYHDLSTDARAATQQVAQARQTLSNLDAQFQRLVAGLSL
ncbi:Hypothetical Protein FCC1311_016782 [Hondaea fermentalgiana]|uniref:Uncharacterized protein n=1 Tax=Hondaea fermentalgiana TaxID=2315210 RepID=A0A2R5G377_9STRA|nr:Hypothetical Protein FCC1311_016782 [Hondaea fermentalgiana]|eukprot:GBG25460.1 Hypothetical Protein FCC1311_016782 [Hondaea fermentalgiana]